MIDDPPELDAAGSGNIVALRKAAAEDDPVVRANYCKLALGHELIKGILESLEF